MFIVIKQTGRTMNNLKEIGIHIHSEKRVRMCRGWGSLQKLKKRIEMTFQIFRIFEFGNRVF